MPSSSFSSLLPFRVKKSQSNILKSGFRLSSEAQSKIEEAKTIQDINSLLTMLPDSPEFLGSAIVYPAPKKSFFLFEKKLPELNELRASLYKKTDAQEINEVRKKVKKLNKKYPSFADIHAINAIQILNDSDQSVLYEEKLRVLRYSLTEIASALHNDGISLFNVIWFVRIYLKYLINLNSKCMSQHQVSAKQVSREIRSLSSNLQVQQRQVMALLSVKDRLGGLSCLNKRLNRTSFFEEGINHEELKEACKALSLNDQNRIITKKRSARHVFWTSMTYALLFARIPILNKLTDKMIGCMPESNRDMLLQKYMVTNTRRLTDFRMIVSAGEISKAQKKAKEIFNNCIQVIDDYLEHTLLTKPFETDPYLVAAWIAKESQNILPAAEHEDLLEISIEKLNVVIGERGQVKGAAITANSLIEELNRMKAQNHIGDALDEVDLLLKG